jgi:DNA-binding MarR family transcriptional regulator
MTASRAGQTATQLMMRLAQLAHGAHYAHGLAPAQWQALDYLARANRFSRTPGALGRFLGVTKGTMSQTVATLARKGLVAKSRDATDRRAVALRLTPSGRRTLDRHPAAAIDTAVATLPGRTRDMLADGLTDLLKALLAARGGRSFGVCGTCRHFGAGEGGGPRGPHRCRLLDEPLSDPDARQICEEHEASPAT